MDSTKSRFNQTVNAWQAVKEQVLMGRETDLVFIPCPDCHGTGKIHDHSAYANANRRHAHLMFRDCESCEGYALTAKTVDAEGRTVDWIGGSVEKYFAYRHEDRVQEASDPETARHERETEDIAMELDRIEQELTVIEAALVAANV